MCGRDDRPWTLVDSWCVLVLVTSAGESPAVGSGPSLVLVGVDGSANGHRALSWAVALAQRLDAEVLAVHALGLLDRLDAEQVVEDFETRWCALLDEVSVRSRRRTEDGPPSMVLLRVAAEEPVDLVVVGSRGVGGFPGLMLGSTSLQVVQHADVPVTVIPDR